MRMLCISKKFQQGKRGVLELRLPGEAHESQEGTCLHASVKLSQRRRVAVVMELNHSTGAVDNCSKVGDLRGTCSGLPHNHLR